MPVPAILEGGVQRRRKAARPAPRREQGAADAVLALQRSAGNHAVSELVRGRSRSARVLQREIVVQNVNYNPLDQEFREGIIKHGAFFDGLTSALRGDDNFRNYHGQLANVIGALRSRSFAKPDINQLTQEITDAVIAEYGSKGLQIPGQRRRDLERHVREGLVANIASDHTMRMEPAEETGFDTLKAIAGAQMSRAKGVPSPVPYDRLPGDLKSGVDAFATRVNTENQRWTLASLQIEFTLPDEQVEGPLITRLKDNGRYQGNHSNMAKWLPDVPAPTDTLDSFRKQTFDVVYAHAGDRLKREMSDSKPRNRLGLNDAARQYRNDARDEFERLMRAHFAGATDTDLRRRVWATLAQGVTGYVEFSLPSAGISRLVYDVVGDKIFLSAHYKWREGYNPWFEVQNTPARVF